MGLSAEQTREVATHEYNVARDDVLTVANAPGSVVNPGSFGLAIKALSEGAILLGEGDAYYREGQLQRAIAKFSVARDRFEYVDFHLERAT